MTDRQLYMARVRRAKAIIIEDTPEKVRFKTDKRSGLVTTYYFNLQGDFTGYSNCVEPVVR